MTESAYFVPVTPDDDVRAGMESPSRRLAIRELEIETGERWAVLKNQGWYIHEQAAPEWANFDE